MGSSHVWVYVIFTVVFVLSMVLLRMYNITTFYYLDRIIHRVLMSTVLAAVCVGTVIFLAKVTTASRLFFLSFCVLGCASVIVERMLTRWAFREHIGNGHTYILFVGDNATLEQYTSYLSKTAMKIKVARQLSYGDPILQDHERFEQLLKSIVVDEVLFVYIAAETDACIPGLMHVCEEMGITTRLVLQLIDLPNSHQFVSSIGTFPVLTYHSVSFNKSALFVKAITDVVGAVVGLILFSPVFIGTAIAIKMESHGPVFFKQVRIGQNGKPFKMYKFRSMYQDAEELKKGLMEQNKIKGGLMFKIDNDPRITAVGKFIRKTSIDELPQLVNVLMQNMSLVGTRPPTPDEVDKYDRGHWRRISIKPGITGMWQTSGRSDILDFEQVVLLDKKYIDEWSLLLDAKILLKTASAVLAKRGAS